MLGLNVLLFGSAFLILQVRGGLVAADMAVATVVSYGLVLLCQAAVLRGRLVSRLRGVEAEYDAWLWFRVDLPLLLIVSFRLIILQSDLIMVGALLRPQDVAFYGAASKTAVLIMFCPQAISSLAAPRISSLHVQRRRGDLQTLLSGSIRWAFWPSCIIALVLVGLGGYVLQLFGPAFQAGYWALVILVFGYFIETCTGPGATLLSLTDHQDVCAKVYIGSALLNVLLNLILIPIFGISGAALATATSVVAAALCHLVLVNLRMGVYPSILSAWRAIDASTGRGSS